jgi:hypothetical protein
VLIVYWLRPSDAAAFEVALLDEVVDDPLGGALGDSNLVGDVAETGVGLADEREQHVCVVGQEGPGARRDLRSLTYE